MWRRVMSREALSMPRLSMGMTMRHTYGHSRTRDSRSRDRRERPLIERIQTQFELEGSGLEDWELDACWVTPWR